MSGKVARASRRIRSVCDRFWMFTIAAIALGIVGFVCIAIVWNDKMPEHGEGLLTGAITGLLMVARDVIRAIIEMLGGDPTRVTVDNPPSDPVKVEDVS